MSGMGQSNHSVAHNAQPTVAFVGLGAMGYQMAKRLATQPLKLGEASSSTADPEDGITRVRGARLHRGTSMHRGMHEQVMRNVLVWNRTAKIADQHAKEFNSVDISCQPFSEKSLGCASVVVMCLPTSEITFERVQEMAPHLAPNAVLVDCCSGHPTITRKISAWLEAERPGIRYVDCAVSGGPGGASQGTLAAFVGGDRDALEGIKSHIEVFARNIVYLGPVGAGHAVKAINNACNVSNLLCLHEGLLALKKMGVNPAAALEVINKSSGRSLMSQARVPEEVLTGDFNYGFKLGLMAKDVGIANDIMNEYFPSARIYRQTLKMHFDAIAAGTVNFDSDYTEIVKHQESAGARLRADDAAERSEGSPSLPHSARALEAQVKALAAENEALRAELASKK